MAPETNPFQLSRRTRTGALVLLFLILALTVVWRLLPLLYPPRPITDDKELQQAWQQFRETQVTYLKEGDQREEATGKAGYDGEERSHSPEAATGHNPVPFDPNTASLETLVAVGFPQRTARTLIKYRSKGGRFRKKEDLQKLYTLSPEVYAQVAPYVRIPAQGAVPPAYERSFPAPATGAPQPLELNGADQEALISLRGIGPGYSRHILNYREALGGFIDVAQLKEVYGFPDSTYQQLKDQLRVDAGNIRRINVNTAGEEELARHPYIGKKLAANIVRLRNDFKSFSEIVQLRQVPLINEEKYRKIAPYLSTH